MSSLRRAITLSAALAGAALPSLPPAAAAAGDAARGEQAFARCRICHSLKAGENRVGPSLNGIFGRKSGTQPDFDYSDAMKSANITWNDDTLSRYLANPQKTVPGNRMAFPGIKDPDQLGDLLAYLKQASK